jgi:TRAP-type C4-dicarboxylate transport system permease small subunit
VRGSLVQFGTVLRRVTEGLAALLLLAVLAMNLGQIYFRYVLVDPISWSEETMRYTTTWMVMLAAAPALLRNEHMVVSLFTDLRSRLLRQAVDSLVHLCVAGFCLLLMWEGFPAALDNMRQVSPAVRIPMTIPYMAIPVGATLLLINTVLMMLLPRDALFKDPQLEDEA